VSEVVSEGFGSAFQLFKHTFDSIPIPVGDMLESERVAMAGRLQPGCAIDKKDRVVDEMFLAEFREEHLG
jgi:hypothetical protein